ncbi:MAG: large conductance mechanosensitive channel protein [Gammaproteobacteria bacterium]|nr:large conductance mechanosensitive channel protein [Gammaproteobacteria bacterium]
MFCGRPDRVAFPENSTPKRERGLKLRLRLWSSSRTLPPNIDAGPAAGQIGAGNRLRNGRMRMSLGSEFKEFAMKGNVIDLAVGVVIGAAFGKIVASLVGDVVMPPLGLVIGNVNFTDLAVAIGHDAKGKDVLWRYGAFIQTIFEFLIIALVLFLIIKGVNRLKRPPAAAPAAAPPPPTRSEQLLEEIRDQLAKR